MRKSDFIYYHGNQPLLGYLACKEPTVEKRPAVLVVHDWSGRNAFACQQADMLAQLGYLGFAVDMYGEARVGETVEEKQALMQPLVNNRNVLRGRIQAALDAVIGMDEVDKDRVAVIGFCFGGLCALDLARSGADIVGAVTFHGILNKPKDIPNESINAKILAFHGYNDPMVTPENVNAFCQEMTEAGVDWQMHMYGNTQHAFTNPLAHDQHLGLMYSEQATRRSFQALTTFLSDLFSCQTHR